MIRIGYACINQDLGRSFKSIRKKNLTFDRWKKIVAWNLDTLESMVDYNIEKQIPILRITSDLIPFGGHQDLAWDFTDLLADRLGEISKKIEGNLRISVHPGQYTVLNSNRQEVVERSIRELTYHVDLLRSLGGDRTNKMVLHIGGAYGDKSSAMDRFIERAESLDQDILDHLVVENDEKIFTSRDVLTISQKTGIPMVFDLLHHQVNPSMEDMPVRDLVEELSKTWEKADGRQVIHYSQQAKNKRAGSHSETIDIEDFVDFFEEVKDLDLDIMLEVKDKNRSAQKIKLLLNPDIGELEGYWAQNKYSVMESSQASYDRIRSLLKDKENFSSYQILREIDLALADQKNIPSQKNAFSHVWGYFKDKASQKEKEDYLNFLENWDRVRAKSFLRKMLKKYPNKYLQNSNYLDK